MDWINIYTTYNDELLTTLANPGLLRRAYKDLESNPVEWVDNTNESGRLAIDGQEILLTAKGIPAATCSCPAPGICKHILAASIWLRTNAVTIAHSTANALADLLALNPESLFKSAGIANVRKTQQLLAEFTRAPCVQESGTNLVIELSDLDIKVNFLAGGALDTMVSSAPEKQAKAIHLAAIISVWQLHQKSFSWPKGIADNSTLLPAQLTEDERHIIAQTEHILIELLSVGLAHISAASAQRLRAFGLSARAEGLPRLASQLRTLSGLINGLAERKHQIEVLDVLLQLAQVYAWCEACKKASGNNVEKLRGQLQRQFIEQEVQLELLPLGAWWWTSPSGARGLNLALLDVHSQNILLAVQARPNGMDPQFNEDQAWSRTPIWSGAGSAQTICTSALQLDKARITGDGHIALGGNTQAMARAPWSIDSEMLVNAGISDWRDLVIRLKEATSLHGYGLECVLLRPTRVTKPTLDEIAQRFFIEACDQHQQKIFLSLPAQNRYEKALTALEHSLQKNATPWGIFARVSYTSFGYHLEPVSLLIHEQEQLRIIVLAYAQNIAPEKSSLTDKLAQLFKSRKTNFANEIPRTIGQRIAIALTPVLESLALTGRLSLNPQQHQVIREQAQQAKAVGLDIIHQQLTTWSNKQQLESTDLLKISYLIRRLCFI
ncbi:MAG: hypothetical protein B0W54_10295 [Cellvibrio sp. 79]|nr:MAG: hypothetical protein B0W54_10295 [Cellvibrio sp. 79]